MAETYPKIVPLSSDIRPRVSGTNSIGTAAKPFSQIHSHSAFVSGVGIYAVSQIPTTGNFTNAPNGSIGLSNDGTGVYYFGNNPVSGVWNQFVTSDASGNYNITLNDPRLSPAQVVFVQQNPGSGQFASIADALNSITDAAANKPYVVFVEPGDYVEPELNVDPYVHIVGRDQSAVTISPSGLHNVINLSNNSSLAFLSILDAPTGYYGVDTINPGDYVLLHKVSMDNCDIGMRVFADNGAVDNQVYLEYVDSTNNNGTTAGFHFENQNGGELVVAAENFYVYGNLTNPTYGIHMVGSGLVLQTKASALEGINGVGHGIVVESGASLVAGVLAMSNWATGVYAPIDGSAPNVILNSTPFSNITDYNIYIANSGATGYMIAYTPIDKQYVNENNTFFMTYRKDHQITVSQKGGDFKSISEAVNYINANLDPPAFDHGYLITVGPGLYSEPTITVPEYTYIQGDDQYAVRIQPTGNNDIFHIGQNTTLSFMVIENVPAGYHGIVSTNPGDFTLLHKIAFENCQCAGRIIANSGTANLVYFEYVDTTQENTSEHGFEFISVSGTPLDISCENFYVIGGNTNPQVGIKASGSGLTMATRASALIGVDGTGKGIEILDGATVNLPVLGMSNWATGIHIPQDAGSPTLKTYAVSFNNNGMNYVIENSGTSGFSNSYSPYLQNDINISSSFFLANKDQRVVVVAKKGGDFASINDALVAITPLTSASSIYTVQVNPGIYDEPAMTVPSFTQIKGDNMEGVIIRPTGDYNLFTMSEDSSMEFLTIFGNGFSTSSSAIVGTDLGSYSTFHKVYVDDFYKGLTLSNQTSGVATYVYLEYFSVQSKYSGTPAYAISVSSDNGGADSILQVDAQNVTIYTYDTDPNDSIILQGQDVKFLGKVVGMEGFNTNPSGSAVTVYNGARFDVNAFEINGYTTGFSNPNLGSPASLEINSIAISNCTQYFSIKQPNTIASIQGTFDKIASDIDSPYVTLMANDQVNNTSTIMGDLYLGKTFDTLQYMSPLLTNAQTMGAVNGGELVTLPVPSGLVVQVSGGYGYVDTNEQDWTQTKYISWNTQNYSGLAANDDVYIYINSNGQVAKSASGINGQTDKILLGRVVCTPTFVAYAMPYPMQATHFGNKLDEYLRDVFGGIVADGLVITSTGVQLIQSAGEYYYSSNLWEPAEKNPISSILQYYHISGSWAGVPNTSGIINTLQWDNGTNLTGLSAGYYTRHGIYYDGPSNTNMIVFGQAQYSGLSIAQTGTSPTPPNQLRDTVIHLADIIVQSGAATIADIIDERPLPSYKAPSQVGGAGVTVHNQLLGLGNDDHTQYLLVNGSRAMTGDLDMGTTNNIINVSGVNGVIVEAHASRHLPNGADSLTTAAASQITLTNTTSNTVGINNSFARSDHGHSVSYIPVNTAGDTMTGNLVMSGSSILATGTAGNIGSSATPFNIIYATRFVESNPTGYVFAYSTGTQTVSVANTFQNITYTHSPTISGWTHTSGNAEFTCQQAGLYEATYTAIVNRTSNPSTTVELRATLDGSEIAGSQSASTLAANNVPMEVSNQIIFSASSGNVFRTQLTAGGTNGQIVAAGANATTRPSIRLSIHKL
jgi:hypothetical protein